MGILDHISEGTAPHDDPAISPVLIGEALSRYQLLATAMSGRGVRVERARGIGASHTDGHTIFLTGGGDRQRDLSELAVQGALLSAGSLDEALVKRMVGRPGLARRYLTIEGWRALAAMAEVLPGVPVVAAARRIELWSSSPEESLAVAISRRPVPEAPEVFGVIRPRRVLAAGPVEVADVPSGEDLARQPLSEEELPTLDEEDEFEDIGKTANVLSSLIQNALRRKLFKKMGMGGKEPGSGTGGTGLPQASSRTTNRPGSKAAVSLLPASLLPTEVLSERGFGWRYPEWDANAGRYRPEWCTVVEVEPRPEDLKMFNPPRSNGLRRALARLGVGLERHRRQPQGDDVDVDAAVESRVELLAGSTPEDGVYIESQRRKRSLSVFILLDITGSAVERASPRTSVHERQREAAAALLDTLNVLGDRVALYGFRSYGASAVYMVRVKGFDDVLDGPCRGRLGGLVPGGYTRLGAAIRHSAFVLATRAGTDRRLLVVLSDGFPYDDGYEGAYGEADARRALAETRRQGVGCLCLTLGASTDARALKRVFGTAAFASAPCLEDLTSNIAPLFRRAMSSADLQRRLAQRVHRAEQVTPKGVT